MRILSQVIEHGNTTQFFATSKNVEKKTKYDPLIDLITEEPIDFITSLTQHCPISSMSDLSFSLFEIFSRSKKKAILLLEMCKLEIAQTDSAPNILRRNSIASYLLTLFAQKEMADFLENAIGSVIRALINSNEERPKNYEVDPSRDRGESPNDNIIHLEQLAQTLLTSVFSNARLVSSNLRFICSHLSEMVEERFPGAGKTAITGLIFLRVICPTIAAPLPPLIPKIIESSSLRRGLLLATKVIQNVANFTGGNFNKEAYMTSFSSFIQRNNAPLISFLDEIAIYNDVFIEDPPSTVNTNYSDDFLAEMIIYSLICKNYDKIRSTNNQTKAANTLLRTNILLNKSQHDKLILIMRDLGDPPTDEELVKLNRQKKEAKSNPKSDFSQSHESSKTIEDFQRMVTTEKIFSICNGKEGRNVIIFNAHKIIPTEVNYDELLNFFFQKTLNVVSKPFDVILNFTFFGIKNEWNNNLIDRIQEQVSKVKSNLINFIVLNPNGAFRALSKRIHKIIGAHTAKRNFIVINAQDLSEFITADNLFQALDKKTSSLLHIQAKSYTAINRIIGKISIPISMQLYSGYLSFSTVKKEELLGTQGYIVEFCNISELVEIRPDHQIADASNLQLFLKFCPENSSLDLELVLDCTKNPHFVDIIRSKISRLVLSKSRDSSKNRDPRAPEIFVKLLNISFINLSDEDFTLRAAGYALLQQILRSYNISEISLVPLTYIPKNTTHFLSDISFRISRLKTECSIDFAHEVLRSFYEITPKKQALKYLSPWLANLGSIMDSENDHDYEQIGMLIKFFLELSLNNRDVMPI